MSFTSVKKWVGRLKDKMPTLSSSTDYNPLDPNHLGKIVFITQGSTTDYNVYSLTEHGEGADITFTVHCTLVAEIPNQVRHLVIPDSHPSHVYPNDENHLHFIVSTRSGFRLAPLFFKSVIKPLFKALDPKFDQKPTVHIITTKSPHTIRQYAKKLGVADWSARRIILLSGDGGVIDVINGIREYCGTQRGQSSSTELHVIPLGTGNGLFHSNHRNIPREHGQSDLVQSLRTMFHGCSCRMPMFKATFSQGATYEKLKKGKPVNTRIDYLYGAVVASHGLHANLVAESDNPEYRKFGSKRFTMAAEELLKVNHEYDCTLDVQTANDGPWVRWDSNFHSYIIASMASCLDKGLVISPFSDPYTRPMHLVHMPPVTRDRFFEIMGEAYQDGRHIHMPDVKYKPISGLRIQVHSDEVRWRKFCIDGTIVTVPKGGTMTVEVCNATPISMLLQPYWYVERALEAAMEDSTAMRDNFESIATKSDDQSALFRHPQLGTSSLCPPQIDFPDLGQPLHSPDQAQEPSAPLELTNKISTVDINGPACTVHDPACGGDFQVAPGRSMS